VDAWTGEALGSAACRDSLRGLDIKNDGNGAYRLLGAPTGKYAIRCIHDRYSDAWTELSLTPVGARTVVKLARLGGEDWYTDPGRTVSVPVNENGVIRYPIGLDWQAAPADDSGRFWYQWTFRQTPGLNRGHQDGNQELPKLAYSPHFRDSAAFEKGVQEGPDTVILKVQSLLNGAKAPYLVDSAIVAFRWVRNKKPTISFLTKNQGSFKVNCPEQTFLTRPVSVQAADSDGTCKTIRVWAVDAPAIAQFDTVKKDYVVTGKLDTTFQCGPGPHTLKLNFGPPIQAGRPHLDVVGSWEYNVKLAAEVTDDNGETGKDTDSFVTYTNAPPTGALRLEQNTYYENDSIPILDSGFDADGNIRRFTLYWQGQKDSTIEGLDYLVDENPPTHSSTHRWAISMSRADNFTVWTRILDGCYGIYDSPKLGLVVEKDFPPYIDSWTVRKDTLDGMLKVSFDMMIIDKEASKARDFITSVMIAWNGVKTDSLPMRNTWVELRDQSRTFPLPLAASSIAIRIIARDDHRKSLDTTLRVPLP
jgi:hypothetical protein